MMPLRWASARRTGAPRPATPTSSTRQTKTDLARQLTCLLALRWVLSPNLGIAFGLQLERGSVGSSSRLNGSGKTTLLSHCNEIGSALPMLSPFCPRSGTRLHQPSAPQARLLGRLCDAEATWISASALTTIGAVCIQQKSLQRTRTVFGLPT